MITEKGVLWVSTASVRVFLARLEGVGGNPIVFVVDLCKSKNTIIGYHTMRTIEPSV